MNEAIIRVGGFQMQVFGLLAVLSFLWGSFVFYKKALRSHFEDFHILDVVVMSAFWAFIAGRLIFVALNPAEFWGHFPRLFLLTNYPGLDRWGVILGIAGGVFFLTKRIKARFWDWFDLVCLGVLSGGAVFEAGLFFMSHLRVYLVQAVVYLLVFSWFWLVEDKYRTYGWYRGKRTSSRSGLISGLSLSFWGASFLGEKIGLGEWGLWSLVWGVIVLVGGLVLVYIRSGRTASEDIKNILKHGRKQN